MRGHGLLNGAALLELGCGPGWSTLKFAEALPDSRVTCVEVDEGMVRRPASLRAVLALALPPHPRARTLQVRAARVLLAGHAQVTVRHGLAQRTGLPSASFDFVTMRFLLQHLRRPSLVLREAMRLLRPGGGVAVVETDDMIGGVMDPLIPSLQPLNVKFSVRQAQQGGSRFVGRHLLRMLRAFGFTERSVEAALAASDEFDEGVAVFAPHFDVTRYRVLIDEGQISVAEYEEAESAIKTFLEDPASMAMMVNMVRQITFAASPPRDASPPIPPPPPRPLLPLPSTPTPHPPPRRCCSPHMCIHVHVHVRPLYHAPRATRLRLPPSRSTGCRLPPSCSRPPRARGTATASSPTHRGSPRRWRPSNGRAFPRTRPHRYQPTETCSNRWIDR